MAPPDGGNQEPLKITKQNIFVIAFFVLLIGLLSLLFTILEPFLRAFVWATILVMVFYPLYSLFLRMTKGNSTISALFSTLVVLGFLALPGFFVVVNLGRELPRAYNFLSTSQWDEKSLWLLDKMKNINLGSWLQSWGIDPNQMETVLEKKVADILQSLSQTVLVKISYVFDNLASFVLEAIFVAVALFFFFRDGSRLALKVIEFLPLEDVHRDKVVHTFSVTVTAVVRAIFLTALLQGSLACMGFVVAGVPVPYLLGLIAFVNSFIPFLGAASVWIPVAFWLYFFQGQPGVALGLTLWGVVITIIDQVLRPWLIGNEAKLPIFWLFFTTIGGLKVYGLLGIFLGPIILSLGMAFLAIYREIYLTMKKPAVPRRAHR
jgi:predicted PurR-regulated permease PerM